MAGRSGEGRGDGAWVLGKRARVGIVMTGDALPGRVVGLGSYEDTFLSLGSCVVPIVLVVLLWANK